MIIHYDKSNEQRKVLLQLSDCYPIDMQTLDDDTYQYYLAIDKNNGVGYGYCLLAAVQTTMGSLFLSEKNIGESISAANCFMQWKKTL